MPNMGPTITAGVQQPNQPTANQIPCTVVFVTSPEIDGLWIPPGYTTFFFNFDAMELYIRKKEMNGMVGPTRVIEMKDRATQPASPQTDVVTRQEFEDLKATILAAINSAQSSNPAPEKEERSYKPRQKGGRR